MTGETYPSGHTVSNSYDQASRLTAFTGSLGDGQSRTYATSITYNAASQMIKEQFGTSTALYHRMHYNSRLQLYDIRLGTDLNTTNDNPNPAYWTNGSWNRGALRLFYNSDLSDYNATPSGAGNNGNLYRADHFIPLDDNLSQWVMPVQYYGYDALNRVTGVSEFSDTYLGGVFQETAPFAQGFSYDRYGNRTIDQANTWVKDGTVWVEDGLPTGATGYADGGDSWTWVTASPSPYSGSSSSQSNITAGEHQHYFAGATATLQVNTGDKLYAYVYLDPANLPSEVMLQWNDGSWEHRAYWGANNIGWGVDGTVSRRYMGPLPASGRWVRLEVAASQVGLEGRTLNGMALTLYGGKATWDRAGKSTLANGGINATAYTADVTSNRLQPPSGVMQYDAVGNLYNDTSTSQGGGRSYDAENRITSATNLGGGTVGTYVYDGEGRRVRRIIGLQETWQVYGIGGELVAEYPASGAASTPSKEYGYRSGQLLVTAEGSSVKWLVADHLGTPRMVVDKSGDLNGTNKVIRHDYLPFGEELAGGVGLRNTTYGYDVDTVRQKFGEYERDNETGLDYVQARYFSSTQGRFTAPDEPFADQNKRIPQSWNLYTYARNNPLRFTDPTGREIFNDEDGNRVSDTNGEVDPETGAVWDAQRQIWKAPGEGNSFTNSNTAETDPDKVANRNASFGLFILGAAEVAGPDEAAESWVLVGLAALLLPNPTL